jgi:deoxyribodipyrimidine photo-lyase
VSHNIFWFRNNLRLHDNYPLVQCIKDSTSISFVYIVNRYLKILDGEENHKNKFLIDALNQLRTNLSKLGHELYVIEGEPSVLFSSIAKQHQINKIYCEKIISPYEKDEELSITQPDVVSYWDSSLLNTEDLEFDVSNLPDTFTTFRKKVESKPITVTLSESLTLPKHADLLNIKSCQLPNYKNTYRGSVDFLNHYTICENGAQKYVKDYFSDNKALEYKQTRNELMGNDFSTKFSVWLAHGLISARQIFTSLKNYEENNGANESTYWILFELLWRDYFRFLHFKYDRKLYFPFGLKNKEINETSQDNIISLEEANTESSFINAGIRELQNSGFLSNRMRQILASFIIFEMKIEWRIGADFFQKYLIDFDIYSNQGNWIYIAGYGTDPRGGRRFNVEKQKNTYDIDNQYEMCWNENT